MFVTLVSMHKRHCAGLAKTNSPIDLLGDTQSLCTKSESVPYQNVTSVREGQLRQQRASGSLRVEMPSWSAHWSLLLLPCVLIFNLINSYHLQQQAAVQVKACSYLLVATLHRSSWSTIWLIWLKNLFTMSSSWLLQLLLQNLKCNN